MANNWPRLSLLEAGVALIDCEHRTPPANSGGYPYIAIPQVKQGRLNLSDCRRITSAHFVEWTRKAKPQPNDVILSRRCNPGETAFVPPGLECALGQNLVLLRADESKLFPPFLRWLVRGSEWWEQVGKFINVGAVFDSLRCADIPQFRLSIPPLHEQRRIADILGTLDGKIELNTYTNETLEAMARAIFRSWFIAFDPVHAKAEGRRPVGVDSTTARLFPESFEDSALGKVPKGWNVKALDEIANFVNGLALQKYPAADDSFLPVIKIAQLRVGNTSNADRANLQVPLPFVIGDGDLLFSWSGSLEVRIWCGGKGALNQHLFKVTSSEFPRWFVYQWLLEHLPGFQAIAAAKATTMGHIQRHHLHSALVTVPDKPILDAASKMIEPVMNRIIANNLQSRDLAATPSCCYPSYYRVNCGPELS